MIKKCLLNFSIFVTILIIGSGKLVLSELNDEAKLSLISKIKQNFRNRFNEIFKSENDLKSFQNNLIVNRNSDCVTEESFNFDDIKNTDKYKNILKYFSSYDASKEDEIVSSLNETCLDIEKIKELFTIKNFSKSENYENFADLIITQLTNKGCDLCNSNQEPEKQSKKFESWIFGLLAATIITMSSFAGAFLIPLTKHKYYKRILMFLISLAIGTLCGTGFLHLIPQAYGVSEDISYNFNNMYIWKSLVILGGLYLFFLVEQIMRFIIQFRKHKKSKKNLNENQSIQLQPLKNNVNENVVQEEYEYQQEDPLSLIINKNIKSSIAHEINKAHLSHEELDNTIAPVAWIIICGEGLHNLIDGLSIGAAFTETLLKGMSLSLAIICEEFPHKLGDFAILLSAGMPLKVALFCNFLSSCFIYIGVALGIVLGENLNANMWIYAIAAGMFIYIAVCDMIPELSEMSLEIEKESIEEKLVNSNSNAKHEDMNQENFSLKVKIQNFLIQNAGILFGFSCMLLLALYAKKISL